jgi:phosphatidylserine synthase
VRLGPTVLHDGVKFWSLLGALAVALLMVSSTTYPKLTKRFLRGRRRSAYLAKIFLLGCVLALTRELALVLVFWVYALSFPVRAVLLRARRAHALPAPRLHDGLPR